MLWLRLPDVAVIVAVYVPFGVPGVVWDDELPPPHPTKNASVSMISGAASMGSRFRCRTNSHPEVSNVKVHASGSVGAGKM
jgi:hypothetical protein